MTLIFLRKTVLEIQRKQCNRYIFQHRDPFFSDGRVPRCPGLCQEEPSEHLAVRRHHRGRRQGVRHALRLIDNQPPDTNGKPHQAWLAKIM